MIIVVPRAEKDYEGEKTYETARGVAVFANYRGDTPMHELMPKVAGQLWDNWRQRIALPPEVHLDNVAKKLVFNQWFGSDMEPKEEKDDKVVENIYEIPQGERMTSTPLGHVAMGQAWDRGGQVAEGGTWDTVAGQQAGGSGVHETVGGRWQLGSSDWGVHREGWAGTGWPQAQLIPRGKARGQTAQQSGGTLGQGRRESQRTPSSSLSRWRPWGQGMRRRWTRCSSTSLGFWAANGRARTSSWCGTPRTATTTQASA